MCAIATVNEKEPVLGTQTLKVIHYLLYQVKCTTFSTISKGGNFTMLTKSELINDIAYEMSGYLTSEGIDHLKTVITFKLVNINLTARKAQYLSVYVAEDGCVISQLRTWSKRLHFLAVVNSVPRYIHFARHLHRGNIGGQKMCCLYQRD